MVDLVGGIVGIVGGTITILARKYSVRKMSEEARARGMSMWGSEASQERLLLAGGLGIIAVSVSALIIALI